MSAKLLAATAMALALSLAAHPADAARHARHVVAKAVAPAPLAWVATWGASQQIPEPNNALSPDDMTDATVRQIVHTSIGGQAYRVRISNAFGTQPLVVGPVHVAQAVSPASPATVAGSDRTLLFSGQATVTVPPGADYLSDPVVEPLAPASNLVVSYYLAKPPAQETGHPGSRATSYVAHGDHTADTDFTATKTVDHWYGLSAVEVETSGAGAIAAIGDSITDGHGATTNGNDRWTDVLAARTAPLGLSVLNYGIGGNHMLTDGLGPNVLARFDRDGLGPAGVRFVILFEGVNDLGKDSRERDLSPAEHQALIANLIASYQQVIDRAHARGLKIYGATITPFTGSDYYHPNADIEADRQAINAWIRAPGHFDGVVDFDAVVRDPSAPDHLLPAFDCGDHLHPSAAGYKAMGEAIDLALFK